MLRKDHSRKNEFSDGNFYLYKNYVLCYRPFYSTFNNVTIQLKLTSPQI
jgi:hypothetical protein